MDYEKAYKEALSRARNHKNNDGLTLEQYQTIDLLFPELKESEDKCIEKIKKDIISYLNNRQITSIAESSATERWISWIEKQGEQKTDFKPKFHGGDWIVWQDKCYKVNYNGCGYELVDQDGFSTSIEYGTIDEGAHLWTIDDAKDHDILTVDGRPFIYCCNNNYKGNYCCIDSDGKFRPNLDFGFNGKTILPATKEQRDLILQMSENTPLNY